MRKKIDRLFVPLSGPRTADVTAAWGSRAARGRDMKIVSVETMRGLDQATIAAGTPSETLMERAGVGAALDIHAFLRGRVSPRWRTAFTVVAGKGNNGGDAFVVAKWLREELAADVTVYAVCARDAFHGAARVHAEALPSSVRFVVCDRLPPEALRPGTVIVDGLLGTGVSGPLRPPYDGLVEQIRASGRLVCALDVPSGLSADTGDAETGSVVADLTVTMGQPKRGLLTPGGLACCGRLRCVDIGIARDRVRAAPGCGEALFSQDISPLLGRRAQDGHKGTFGHVLVVGGSRLYVGAPFLAGGACLRSGAGLATVAVPEAARPFVREPLNALMVRAVPDDGAGFFQRAGCETIDGLLQGKDAVVFGPGVGRSPGAEHVLARLLTAPVPLVMDADGLRTWADHHGDSRRGAPTVVTPHPGEMRYLLTTCGSQDLLTAPREEQARRFSERTGLFVVLKGRGTVLASPDGRWAINTSGTDGLATAGTGDVLAGMLGGLLAQGFEPWDALRIGVFTHGFCAETAGRSDRALVADDLLDLLPEAWRELTPFS